MRSVINRTSVKAICVLQCLIKDSIDADVKYDKDGAIDEVDYFNEDVKNTGVELSYAIKHDDNWSTRWGATYQNPKAQNIHNYGDMD